MTMQMVGPLYEHIGAAALYDLLGPSTHLDQYNRPSKTPLQCTYVMKYGMNLSRVPLRQPSNNT